MNTPQTNDSGPAFPCEEQIRCNGEVVDTRKFTGMTLRDWFAGQALNGWMAQPDGEFSFQWANEQGETRLLGYGMNPTGPGDWKVTRTPTQGAALHFYSLADAMLAAREEAK